MTLDKTSILAMGPGRRLDALVGAEIMGLKNAKITEDGYRIDFTLGELPYYSTDISSAIDVARKMCEHNLELEMNINYKNTYWVTFGYSVCLERGNEEFEAQGFAGSENLAEAICKAALIAVI